MQSKKRARTYASNSALLFMKHTVHQEDMENVGIEIGCMSNYIHIVLVGSRPNRFLLPLLPIELATKKHAGTVVPIAVAHVDGHFVSHK